MPTRVEIDDIEFAALVLAEPSLELLVGKAIFDRLPYAFENADQYLNWRHELGTQLKLDPRDILVVGSRAVGRSLNPQKRFRPMRRSSDIDLAIVSNKHFNEAWAWFRAARLAYLTLDEEGRKLFDQHRHQYIFDGYVRSDYFLDRLPFGNEWRDALTRCERLLPLGLQGKACHVRIYKDNESLRLDQRRGIESFKKHLEARRDGRSEDTSGDREREDVSAEDDVV